jgi:iron complex transport system permease protein
LIPARIVGLWALLLLVVSAAGLVLGTAVGSQGWEVWWTAAQDLVMQQIVWDIRLPRSLGAWLGGALLGLAGAIAQGLFRNPLADPYLLGSASGASLGVSVYLSLFGGSMLATAWLLTMSHNQPARDWPLYALTLLTTLVVWRTKVHMLWLIGAGALLGALGWV